MTKVAFLYKGKTKEQAITALKDLIAVDADQVIDITDENGAQRNDVLASTELASLAAINNFGAGALQTGAVRAPRLEVPVGTKPRTTEVDCTINQVSPIRGTEDNGFYHVVTYTDKAGNTEIIRVNPKFVESNKENFTPGACIRMTLEHRIANQTQYVFLGSREMPVPAELRTHTTTGVGLSGIVMLTPLQVQELENDMRTGMLVNKATKIGGLLEGYGANPNVLNALATVLAGQKL